MCTRRSKNHPAERLDDNMIWCILREVWVGGVVFHSIPGGYRTCIWVCVCVWLYVWVQLNVVIIRNAAWRVARKWDVKKTLIEYKMNTTKYTTYVLFKTVVALPNLRAVFLRWSKCGTPPAAWGWINTRTSGWRLFGASRVGGYGWDTKSQQKIVGKVHLLHNRRS